MWGKSARGAKTNVRTRKWKEKRSKEGGGGVKQERGKSKGGSRWRTEEVKPRLVMSVVRAVVQQFNMRSNEKVRM